MACRDICKKYKAKTIEGNKHYALGHKRCSICNLFVNWDGIHCPCCNCILRTRPKSASDRYQLFLVKQLRKNKE